MGISKKHLAILTAVIVVLLIVIIVLAVVLSKDDDDEKTTPTPTSYPVAAEHYSKAVVAADSYTCSKIGNDVLKKKGSAVDAAVASLFCIGLMNMHSTGIGGGGFMTVYLRDQKKCIIYDFRETAPANATQKMFINGTKSSVLGGSASGIPGNVKGMHHVWKKHGKLTWSELVQPTIDLAENGYEISKTVGDQIGWHKDTKLQYDAGFRELLQKPDGTWRKAGDIITNSKLASTFKQIQANPNSYYDGTLADEIVLDMKESGGIISHEDLKNYKVKEREPLETVINGLKFYLMPPPGSGAVIGMAMNILKGYNLTAADDIDDDKRIKTWHKYIEALKFAFARRPLLGDPSFEKNVTKVTDAMLNQTFAEQLRQKIRMTGAYPNQTYYGGYYSPNQEPYGTSHLSILAENGDAVSTTDTINYAFGNGNRSMRNGIIYNNEMDDFSTPGLQNLWGYLPAEANFIKPGKRPLSSMSPTIVVDANGDVVMVVGGSGGSRIISGTATTLVRKLYLQMELGKAVSENRLHTHLLPYKVYWSTLFPIKKSIRDGMEKLKHVLEGLTNDCVVQAIYRSKKGASIAAKSDPRKGGRPAGY